MLTHLIYMYLCSAKFVNSTVMNRNFLISRFNCSFRQGLRFALASVCVLLTLSSCQDYDLGYTSTEISYETQFVKEFGTPAPGHQWGFDVAEYCMGGEPETRAVIKQDMNVGNTNLRTTEVYGRPADITEREHNEVYAWFSNHKVDWTNSPTWFKVDGNRTNQTSDNIAHVIDSTYPNYGSLKDSKYNNTLGDYVMESELGFFNGWIQHVANDPTMDEKSYGSTTYSCANMDYLCFHDLRAKKFGDHLNDFNAASGYGWGNQNNNNAILVTETDFNVCTYGCSAGSSNPHDKYFIVYLEGDGYAGWYLGMDFEADKDGANPNERVKADGICNDWIIKIQDVGNTVYNPARIMCEDLGGTFDTDFNDIVYDVKYENPTCVITMQAAGGTMPIELWYGEKDKQGSIRLTYNGQTEIHAMFGAEVSQPVNVKADYGVDGREPIVFALKFNNNTGTYRYGNRDIPAVSLPSSYDFSKIHVYVYNEGRAEWINIDNQDQRMPLRICVPAGTRWCQECKSIKEAYSGFNAWVQDPTVTFWDKTKNTSLLY